MVSVWFFYGFCAEFLRQRIDSIGAIRGHTIFACFLRKTDRLAIVSLGLAHAAGGANGGDVGAVHVP